ncbi:hypothetical protein J7K06_06610 [Candidatus Bathyarchaeota archaeon]|nr:hypothetical protein [Candidatus Bathyarchaeota archaeon]
MKKENSEELEERKRKLAKTLYKQFYHVVKDNPKVKKLLTEKEIENGLKTLIDKIIERIIEKEQRTGRKLPLEEIKEIIMKVLNELASTSYIV